MQKKSGFTLLELMVVIAIICILTAITAPPIDRWMTERGVHQAAVQMTELMQRAKLIAMRNSTTCSIIIPINDLYVVMTNNPPNNELVWLDNYRGNVFFVNDPGTGAAPPFMITFTPQGLVTFAGAQSIVLTSTAPGIPQNWFRVSVSAAGGISLDRWDSTTNRWFVVT